MKKELNELENPKHESINKVINSYAVKVDHVPSKYTLFGEKMDVIERYINKSYMLKHVILIYYSQLL